MTTILSKNYAKRRTGIPHKIWNKYKWILKTNLHLKGHLIMIYSIDGLNVKCESMLVGIDLLRRHGKIRASKKYNQISIFNKVVINRNNKVNPVIN
jgi:hypothetical protein